MNFVRKLVESEGDDLHQGVCNSKCTIKAYVRNQEKNFFLNIFVTKSFDVAFTKCSLRTSLTGHITNSFLYLL